MTFNGLQPKDYKVCFMRCAEREHSLLEIFLSGSSKVLPIKGISSFAQQNTWVAEPMLPGLDN